jgi:hypothetical protein
VKTLYTSYSISETNIRYERPVLGSQKGIHNYDLFTPKKNKALNGFVLQIYAKLIGLFTSTQKLTIKSFVFYYYKYLSTCGFSSGYLSLDHHVSTDIRYQGV